MRRVNHDSLTIDDGYRTAAPTKLLFKQNKESLEQMLVRKLRQKYVDGNEVFCEKLSLLISDETAKLLSNNFLYNEKRRPDRSQNNNT